MKKQTLVSAAADGAGFSFLIGGVIIFLGYFWPELTGWVWLTSIVGPAIRQCQAVVFVVGIITGFGLLRRAAWARQLAAPVCLLVAAGLLTVLGIEIVYRAGQERLSLIVRCVACGLSALYFLLLCVLLTLGRDRVEAEAAPAPYDPAADEQEKTARTSAQRRAAAVASLLSLGFAVGAPAAAVFIARNPGEKYRWAIAIPFWMFLNVIGASLGGAAFRQSEESPGGRKASVAGTLLNLLPILAILYIVTMRPRGYGE